MMSPIWLISAEQAGLCPANGTETVKQHKDYILNNNPLMALLGK
jgi:hypothetical protein